MPGRKKILLGVCGSIAAYKSAVLVRLLVKAGADVRVVMTPEATAFITPLTLATLSKNPVLVDSYDAATGQWNNHVDLGLWADLLLIAPASANTIAKLANGQCDNLLTTVYLSARCPVYLAPAMDLDMWKHPSVQANTIRLGTFGNTIIPPENGELASGLSGEGRMAEPEAIVAFLLDPRKKKAPLAGKRALVSAGPTYEAIDPVRFIGNHSSGKMGFAIAAELRRRGAEVILVSGPVALPDPGDISVIRVTSAEEMFRAMSEQFPKADITVMSAAVADYAPAEAAQSKIKKQDAGLTLQLTKTTDILYTLGTRKQPGQLLIGFALETDHEEENALGKLKKKNLDVIVLNSLNDAGAGFRGDQNKVTLIDANGGKTIFPLKTKTAVAADLCDRIIALMK
jgi:phosphopantothenoylcysteine decarboxylase/phosphopantothenate--cysteine ligase